MKKYTTAQDLKLLSESALESSLAGYWDWNMATNEEYLSPRFKEMFGYADHEMENTPEAWQKIAFKEDLTAMFRKFEAHVKSRGQIQFKSIVRYHHKNGNTIWVRCNGKVVEWSENNEPLRAVGCHVDITEEKEVEQSLIKALKERDVLLKEVHHRVKNNLQLLLSLSRLKDKNGKCIS
jgi:PAS domain S-box-containing protein